MILNHTMRELKKGTLLKIIPMTRKFQERNPKFKRNPNFAPLFHMDTGEYFDIPVGTYVLFLEVTSQGNAVVLHGEQIFVAFRWDVEIAKND